MAGKAGADNLLTNDIVKPTLSLVGHLNFGPPESGAGARVAEIALKAPAGRSTLRASRTQLFSNQMAAMIVANGETVPQKS